MHNALNLGRLSNSAGARPHRHLELDLDAVNGAGFAGLANRIRGYIKPVEPSDSDAPRPVLTKPVAEGSRLPHVSGPPPHGVAGQYVFVQ